MSNVKDLLEIIQRVRVCWQLAKNPEAVTPERLDVAADLSFGKRIKLLEQPVSPLAHRFEGDVWQCFSQSFRSFNLSVAIFFIADGNTLVIMLTVDAHYQGFLQPTTSISHLRSACLKRTFFATSYPYSSKRG
jgi:hypothetical protein